MKRKLWFRILAVGVVVSLGAFVWFWPSLRRLQTSISLFEPDQIVENFRSMDEVYPSRPVAAPTQSWTFKHDGSLHLPETYTHAEQELSVAELLTTTWTTTLLVVRDDTILYENYWRGYDAKTRHISWSLGKSFVSALVGIAFSEGKFASLSDPISRYVPELAGSGLDGVAIKDVLQMSTGLRFNEDYADYDSDVNRMGRAIAFGSSLDEFSASFTRSREPGTYHQYISINTQALGMLLSRVTGQNNADYLRDKIWQPLGMEADATWLTDDYGVEFAVGGINAVARDYARFGRLYLKNGNWNGKQIVPESWVRASVTPDAPHLLPGENPASDHVFGYGYHWWIPSEPDGDYLAIGIYNQYIYVYPRHDLIIVKLSANPDYNKGSRTPEALAAFRAIARALPTRPN